MPGTARRAADGQRDVDALLDQDPGVALGLEHPLALGERPVHLSAGLPDPRPASAFGGRRQGGDLAVGQGEGAAVAGVGEPGRLEVVQVVAAAAAASASASAARRRPA